MLKVTSKKEGSIEIWELEGKLSGEWVGEFERCWKDRPPLAGIAVQVNLKAVSYIDAAGKQLLTEMHRCGVEIKGCGCMTRAVVEEIVGDAESRATRVSSKKILAMILLAICVLSSV